MKQNFNFISKEMVVGINHNGLAESGAAEQRCHCGQLLARLVAEGVELKCKRCKQLCVIPLMVSR